VSATSEDQEVRPIFDRSIPPSSSQPRRRLRTVLIAASLVAALGISFIGGVAYGEQRTKAKIVNALEDAFKDFPSDESTSTTEAPSGDSVDHAGATGQPPATAGIKLGETATIQDGAADFNGETTLEVTPTKIQCGIKGFDTPNGISTDSEKKQILASEGMRFCVLDIKFENVGKKAASGVPSGTIVDDQGRQFEDDDELVTGIADSESTRWMGNELRPTRYSNEEILFEIPIGAAPATILLDTAGEPLPIEIDAGEISWVHPKGE
jgi:hypothetical protein